MIVGQNKLTTNGCPKMCNVEEYQQEAVPGSRSDSLGENAKMTMVNAASVILYSLPILLALPIFRWDTSLGPTSFHQSWQGSTIQFLDSKLPLVELLDQKTQVGIHFGPTYESNRDLKLHKCNTFEKN